jgi:hypothetical protein
MARQAGADEGKMHFEHDPPIRPGGTVWDYSTQQWSYPLKNPRSSSSITEKLTFALHSVVNANCRTRSRVTYTRGTPKDQKKRLVVAKPEKQVTNPPHQPCAVQLDFIQTEVKRSVWLPENVSSCR